MKVKIPFIGFIDKTINADFVQAFLRVFRETEDKHRVFIVIPAVLLISHSYYMFANPLIRQLSYTISKDKIIWVVLAAFPILFMLSWAVFSSAFNPRLYVRQTVLIIWAALLHRLAYGLEVLGTTYFTVVSFIALTSFLPFAITGLKIEELFNRIKDDYKERREAESEPFIHVRPVSNDKVA